MDFNRLFLGYRELDNFLNISIKEGFISSYHDSFYDDDFNEAAKRAARTRIGNKSSLLRMLLLFENIDSNRLTSFDISRLVDSGLISSKSIISHYGVRDSQSDISVYPELAIQDKLILHDEQEFVSFVNGLFLDIDKRYKIYLFEEIEVAFSANVGHALAKSDIARIEHLISHYNMIEIVSEEIFDSIFERSCVEEFYRFFNNSFDELLKISKKLAKIIIDKHILAPCMKLIQVISAGAIYSKDKNIERYMQLVDSLYTVKGKNVCSSCDLKNSVACLDKFECDNSLERYVTLLDVYSSSELGLPVFSTYLKPELKGFSENTSIIDDVYYLMKVPELNQLNNLPTPQSISEALYLRNRPEIISFREVFKTWCESLQNYDDEHTIKLITKDFTQASKALEKQYENRQKSLSAGNAIKQNLLSIVLQVPGFFVPGFSLLFDLPAPWINRRDAITRQKSEWFMLTR